jgi:hypothetical protein
MFPTVERKLVIRRTITLIEIPLSLNLSFAPDYVSTDFKPHTTKEVHCIGPQNHPLLTHRREDQIILVVKVIEDIE